MKTYNVFVFGIDKAGKTNLVQLLKKEEPDFQIKPTLSFNIEKFIYDNVEFHIWDAPGQLKLRESWLRGYERAKIMMFVLDIHDKSRFEESKNSFLNVVNDEITLGIPIIFCIHKCDLEENYQDFESIKTFFTMNIINYRRILWLPTSIFDIESIHNLRNTLLDVVLVRAKIAESYINILDGFCHDINSQIMVIKNFADLLSQRISDVESKEYISFINIGIEQTYNFIRKIKPNFNEDLKKQEFTDIQKVVNDSVLFISRGNQCEIKKNLEPEFSFIPIEIENFTQIINNLLINATEAVNSKEKKGLIQVFTKKVNITKDNLPQFIIHQKISSRLHEGFYVQLIIEDNGVGIPLSEQEKIFTLNYTTKNKGHGIGLANVYSLVSLAGGFIDFKSKLGEGTTFFLYFPVTV